MKKLSKEKQQQIIATAIGAVVVCGLIWYFVIMGQQKTLADTRKKIADTETEVGKAEALIKKQQQTEADLEAVQKKIGELEQGMAAPDDLYSWVIRTMNKFKLGHKVEVRNYSREEVVKVGTLANFPYQGAKFFINGSAYFHDFGKYIADFENKFPYFRVQNIELNPGGDIGDDPEKLSFKMEIVVLIQPAAKP